MDTKQQRRESRVREVRKNMLQLMLERTMWADLELRSRISTLSSVVFGLSLLALQVEDPRIPAVVFAAWMLLGLAVIGSVLNVYFVNRVSSHFMQESIRMYVEDEQAGDQVPKSQKFDVAVLWISGFSLIAGVVLLVIFAANNMP